MRISRLLLGLAAVAAITVPAVAFAVDKPPNPPDQAKAYGVICKREPYNTKPGTPEFSRVRQSARQGHQRHHEAQRCGPGHLQERHPAAPGRKFGQCVSSTKTLVEGLAAIKAQ